MVSLELPLLPFNFIAEHYHINLIFIFCNCEKVPTYLGKTSLTLVFNIMYTFQVWKFGEYSELVWASFL